MKACSSLWAGFVQPCNSALPTDQNLRVMGTPGNMNHLSWSWLTRWWGRDSSFPKHLLVSLFFLKWVFFLLFFQWKQLFLESRLKDLLLVTDNSETQCSSKSLQPFNPETPLSAAWIACAAEQIPSLIPSSLCKIKIHHRHSTGYSFVLGTGSDIAICGWEQWVEVTEPTFQEIPKPSQDGWKAADAQLCNAEDLHWI